MRGRVGSLRAGRRKRQQLEQAGLVDHAQPEFARLVELAAGFRARDDAMRLLADRARDLGASGFEHGLGLNDFTRI